MKRVYFIRPVGMKGPIKIGCSYSPDGRRATLDTWSPFALEILAEIDGDFIAERRFHALFIHLHQRREWFTPAPELLETIAAINAGTFDVATLPEPRRVDGLTKGPRRKPPHFAKQLSYSLRINHAERKSGLYCPVKHYDMVKKGDIKTIAVVDMFLADPAQHGVATSCRYRSLTPRPTGIAA